MDITARKEAIDEFESMLKDIIKDAPLPMDEVTRGIAACKEIDWDYFSEHLLEELWLESNEWDRIEIGEFVLNGFSPVVYENIHKEQIIIELSFGEHDLFAMTAFDIKKLNEIVYKNSSESDIRVLLMAITFLATNFIRRVCEIPEIVYN